VRYPTRLVEAGLCPVWLFLPGLLAGLRSTPARAAAVGWGFGLLADLLSLEPLGVHAFLFGVAAYCLGHVRSVLFSDHPGTQGVAAFVLTALVGFALTLRIELSGAFDFLAHGPAVLSSAAFTGVVFPLLVWLDDRVGIVAGFRERDRRVQA